MLESEVFLFYAENGKHKMLKRYKNISSYTKLSFDITRRIEREYKRANCLV